MSVDDAYAPLIGTRLNQITVSAHHLDLFFTVSDDLDNVIKLHSMADFCVKKSRLFKPYSEYDVLDPKALARIYSCLGQTVRSFQPLELRRACKMEFDKHFFYCWAHEGHLPPVLFEAVETVGATKKTAWGIDDV